MRTPRSGASASAGSWDHVTHIGGAPGTTVTPRSRMVSSAVTGSKRCTRTALAPTWSVRSSDDREAHDVVEREDAEHDVVGSEPVAVGRADLAQVGQQVPVREHRRRRGAGRAAREHQQGERVARDVDRRRRAPSEQLVEGVRAVEVVARASRRPMTIAPVTDGWTDCHAAAAIGPTTAATGETSDSWRSISGPGLVGLSGTATAPSPTVARRAMMKYGSLPHRSATRSPGPTPRSVRARRGTPPSAPGARRRSSCGSG